MKTDSHFVSLIIPSIGSSSLQHTKAALKSQTRPPDELIIIFDKHRYSQCWARNKGFKQAKGDLIAFMDEDCVPGNDWLERMVVAIDKYGADMVNGHYNETEPFLREIKQHRKFPSTTRINPEGFIGNAGNVVYQRECLEQCQKRDGYIFNPIFRSYGSEDVDLAFRVRLKGHKLVYIDNNVNHLKKMTFLKYLPHQFNRGIGIGMLYEEHKKKKLDASPDKSLLWNNNQARFSALKWLVMIWKKVLGPFDRKSFSSMKHFWTFWMGEKFQAIGFLYAVVFKYRHIKKGYNF
jgi:glycosyltransferase involved in cell wall biosynthesis